METDTGGADRGGQAAGATGRIWLVDGFNALHVGLLRGAERGAWWRREGRQRLVERLRSFPLGRSGDELWVVFDGPHAPRDESEAGGHGPRVVFAPSADAWLLRRIREAPDPGRLTLVTADRRLADRARARGARVEAPAAFLARCTG